MIRSDHPPVTCDALDRCLDDLLDGEAPVGNTALTRDRATRHVALCPRCREEHGATMAFLHRLETGPDVPLPAASRPPAASSGSRTQQTRPTMARVAAVVLVAVVAGLWGRTQRSPPVTATPVEPSPSAVLEPLQQITPVRYERHEHVAQWTRSGWNRAESRTIAASYAEPSGAIPPEEETR
jgi:hypothetical protein